MRVRHFSGEESQLQLVGYWLNFKLSVYRLLTKY